MSTNHYATVNKALIERVRDARKEAGLSQEDIARQLGLTDGGYGHYERGRQSFTLEMLFQLGRILGRPVEYFLGLDTGLTDDEGRLLALYRAAPAGEPRAMVLRLVQSLVQEA